MSTNAASRLLEQLDGILRVPGWLTHLDILMLVLVTDVQTEDDLEGDLLEIGVFCGRSAIVLGYLRSPGDRLVVCDTFADNSSLDGENAAANIRWYGEYSREQFELTFARFHSDPPLVHARPSATLDRTSLPAGVFRLVHIDGGHDHDTVRGDLRIASEALSGQGVVVVDDYCKADAPGVAAAIWQCVADGAFYPILLTGTKLYAAREQAAADRYARLVTERLREHRELSVESYRLFDRPVPFVRLRSGVLLALSRMGAQR